MSSALPEKETVFGALTFPFTAVGQTDVTGATDFDRDRSAADASFQDEAFRDTADDDDVVTDDADGASVIAGARTTPTTSNAAASGTIARRTAGRMRGMPSRSAFMRCSILSTICARVTSAAGTSDFAAGMYANWASRHRHSAYDDGLEDSATTHSSPAISRSRLARLSS